MGNYSIIFDEVILKQLKKLGKDEHTKEILTKVLNKIEELGPNAGKILDPRLKLYEIKRKHPPLRLYYKIVEQTKEAYVFEYEMKTSKVKQSETIGRIRDKSK